MLIDWFTVIAQIVNFLVLVWLLKIFLYKPILKNVADRQNEINRQIDEAKSKRIEAEAEYEAFKNRNIEFDQQREEKIKTTNEEIEQLRDRLKSEAHLESDNQKEKWYISLRNEKDAVFSDLSNRVQKEIFSILRKTASDLADVDLEERMIDVFLQRLKTQTKKPEFSAISTLQIKTATEISAKLREKITKAIQKELEKVIEIKFTVSPDLIAGIELLSNGQKISWSIADYLASLESQVNQVVDKKLERSNG